ncbi:MAG TPA: hypothetical protein VF174_04695 [Micromonosporaceae bacterium]
MADRTNAERQRRHRRHKAGDHSLCDPRRCDDAVTPVVTRPLERRLGPRGARLWEEEGGDSLTGVRRNVLEEACRLVDRLDRLDAILNGRDRAWLTLEVDDETGGITVVVDKILSEARQQQLALKQLAAELRAGGGAAKPATEGSILDQLAARRAQRLAKPAG